MSRPKISSAAGTTLLAAVAAALVVPAVVTPGIAAAEGGETRATLVRLTVDNVPALGLTAYHGVYGGASSPGFGLDGGDFSDPDGVLDRITIATKTTRTESSAARDWAQAQVTDLDIPYNGRSLLNVASFDSHAECVRPPGSPSAFAYNRSDSDAITVAGKRVGLGETVVPVHGADYDMSELGEGKLTVTVERHEDPAERGPSGAASAWLNIAISAEFGAYTGRVLDVRLGEVHANCGGETTPTTSTSPSTTDSPVTTTTDSVPTTGPESSTVVPSPGATTTTTSGALPVGGSAGSSSGEDGSLAQTGVSNVLWMSIGALVLLAAGAAAVVFARRRRSA
ncbi:LPXTG cell wall anchor domain-containing protein [Saccharothrix obliqua]|uniref:LPXTG cell wall anchor domain-containing protein n=1 Tax=Saccharothrix obliqua TaxID=2861747 RepID=UPI001C5D667F|nr:LPXTG cell wall anchor domain-containing protein [Saccharothrix obliqua]MBW4716803.1 LPXTG cell wall anchor domain-containing protein [Saccharothrix obliqua]